MWDPVQCVVPSNFRPLELSFFGFSLALFKQEFYTTFSLIFGSLPSDDTTHNPTTPHSLSHPPLWTNIKSLPCLFWDPAFISNSSGSVHLIISRVTTSIERRTHPSKDPAPPTSSSLTCTDISQLISFDLCLGDHVFSLSLRKPTLLCFVFL